MKEVYETPSIEIVIFETKISWQHQENGGEKSDKKSYELI